MFAHHHMEPRRVVRLLIFIWTLLLLLILLPVRVHGQELLETAPSLQIQLATLFAAEAVFLFVVVISYLLMRARSHHHQRSRLPH